MWIVEISNEWNGGFRLFIYVSFTHSVSAQCIKQHDLEARGG
jgi:hypothetical protein